MDRRFYEHLVGRPYLVGVDDCYGLIRDFYKFNYNIVLPDFARPEHLWGTPNDSLWVKMSQYADFDLLHVPPAQLRVGDVMGFAVRSEHLNHLGIYVGNNMFLHHVYGKVSEVSILSTGWKGLIMVKARHSEVGERTGYGTD